MARELTFRRGTLVVTRKPGGRVELARRPVGADTGMGPSIGADVEEARWLLTAALPACLAGDPGAARELVADPGIEVSIAATTEAPLTPADPPRRPTPALF